MYGYRAILTIQGSEIKTPMYPVVTEMKYIKESCDEQLTKRRITGYRIIREKIKYQEETK